MSDDSYLSATERRMIVEALYARAAHLAMLADESPRGNQGPAQQFDGLAHKLAFLWQTERK